MDIKCPDAHSFRAMDDEILMTISFLDDYAYGTGKASGLPSHENNDIVVGWDRQLLLPLATITVSTID